MTNTIPHIPTTPGEFLQDRVSKVCMTFMDVTPQIAREWLKSNTRNRKLSDQHVNYLGKMIRNGQWCVNGEGISFLDSGELCNGQHRLHAIIKENVTIRMTVFWNLPEAALHSVDGGKIRVGADILTLSGIKVPHQSRAHAAMKWIRVFQIASLIRGEKPTHYEIAGDLATHMGIFESLKNPDVVAADKLTVQGSAIALHYLMLPHLGDARTNEFFRKLATGLNLDQEDPVYWLREALVRNRTNKSNYKLDPSSIGALLAKGFNHYMAGTVAGRKLSWTTRENFPVLNLPGYEARAAEFQKKRAEIQKRQEMENRQRSNGGQFVSSGK